MSTIKANTILPAEQTHDITLGASGDTLSIAADNLSVNTVKDKGGNTLWTSDGAGNLSNVSVGLQANLVLLSSQTASGVTNITFSSSLITSTYDVYVFKFIDINPDIDNTRLNVNFSSDGGSTFMTKTSTYFRAVHDVSDTSTGVAYDTGDDLAQSTDIQKLCHGIGSAADECGVGELYLFGATSTTYVKHWYSTMQVYYPASGGFSIECFTAGYCNTSSAINQVIFEATAGAFHGTIKMYGLL